MSKNLLDRFDEFVQKTKLEESSSSDNVFIKLSYAGLALGIITSLAIMYYSYASFKPKDIPQIQQRQLYELQDSKKDRLNYLEFESKFKKC